MSTSVPPPAPSAATTPRAAGAGPAAVALTLGVAGLAAGFLVLPLLASVVAITMGSLGLQAVAQGRADAAITRRLRAAIGCGIAALAIWIPVVVVAAVAQS